MLYALFWPIAMDDAGNDFVPWLRHIVDLGPLKAFSAPFAIYNMPYLYLLALVSPFHGLLSDLSLVKIVSLAGTVALAIATFRLLRTLGVAQASRWAALIMVMPTSVLNAALLSQSDAIWAAPCVAALDAAIGRRHRTMLLWCGIAISVKLQAILFAPFVIALLLQRRVPIRLWPIAPAVFVALLVPALCLGWPPADLATIYLRQAAYFPMLSLNAPNIWFAVQTLFPASAPGLSGLATAAAVGASAFYIARFSVLMPSGDRLLPVALLAPLLTAGLLPHMHERYFFLADVIALIWAVKSRDRKAWIVAGLVQLGSTLAVAGYVYDLALLVNFGFVAMAVATYMVTGPLLKRAANDNPLLARVA